jgi:hypothetical protein
VPTTEELQFQALYGPISHPYYIYSPPWVESSAGIKALHLLCHALNSSGQTAYMILVGDSYQAAPRVNGLLHTPVLTKEIARAHFEKKLTPITVYSETIHGNPLDAPFVVRFIANYLGDLGGPIYFDQDEFICAYSKTLNDHAQIFLNRKDLFTLFFHAIDPRGFESGGAHEDYVLVYAAKYRLFVGEPEIPQDMKVIEIIRDGVKAQSRPEVIDLLSKARALLLYENSAIAMEAILLGTPVILMKSKFHHTGIASYETQELGMRWGYSDSNVAEARKELSAAKELYFETVGTFFADLELFVNKTQLRASKQFYKKEMKVPDSNLELNQHRLRIAWRILLTRGPWRLLKITLSFIDRRITVWKRTKK